MAAGTVTTTLQKVSTQGKDPLGVLKLTFSWTGGTGDDAGTVPATDISAAIAARIAGMKAIMAVTVPGSTAPTASYDITITDENDVDIFGGALANRSASAGEQVSPSLSGSSVTRVVDGVLTFNLTNNSVESATGTCTIYLENVVEASDSKGIPVAAASGTVNAITANFSPDITLSDKMLVGVVSTGANTVVNPTFAPDGLTAHTITKNGGTALQIGDIAAGSMILLQYNLANTRWELLNPKYPFEGIVLLSSTTVSFAADGQTTLYTVPTGKRCILDKAVIIAAADAGTTTCTIGQVGALTDFLGTQTLSNLDAQYDVVTLQAVPNATPVVKKSYAATTVIQIDVGAHAGAAGNTVLLYGSLY